MDLSPAADPRNRNTAEPANAQASSADLGSLVSDFMLVSVLQ